MHLFFSALAILAVMAFMSITSATESAAQATCRQKCTNQEQACLKRTGNKSQCGGAAQACLVKCK